MHDIPDTSNPLSTTQSTCLIASPLLLIIARLLIVPFGQDNATYLAEVKRPPSRANSGRRSESSELCCSSLPSSALGLSPVSGYRDSGPLGAAWPSPE